MNTTSNFQHSYYKTKRLSLAGAIENKIKVYLDTKFWIYFCELKLGRLVPNRCDELYHLLDLLVSAEHCICPISRETLIEVLKQSDPVTLNSTAEVIDHLSQGISLVSPEERSEIEFAHLIDSIASGDTEAVDENPLVWTKIIYGFGFVVPDDARLGAQANSEMQRFVIDKIWSSSFMDMIDFYGLDGLAKFPKLPDISNELTSGKMEHLDDDNSYKKVYLKEVAGILDFHEKDISRLLKQRLTGDDSKVSVETLTRKISDLIIQNMRKNKFRNMFPSIHIQASIHAATRWDRGRKYKSNDWFDFCHAQAALPYCDLFFTESSLSSLISQKLIKLDEEYTCGVCHDVVEAVETLRREANKGMGQIIDATP